MRPVGYAVVPFRENGKKRLSGAMSPAERREFSRTMLFNVLDKLRDCDIRVRVVSSHPVDGWADSVEWVRDPGRGLNFAISSALHGPGALVVVSDLPDISVADLRRLEQCEADVAVARSRDGGTSALLMRELITPCFGKQSALAHAIEARKRGLKCKVLDLPSLAADVDRPQDLIRST